MGPPAETTTGARRFETPRRARSSAGQSIPRLPFGKRKAGSTPTGFVNFNNPPTAASRHAQCWPRRRRDRGVYPACCASNCCAAISRRCRADPAVDRGACCVDRQATERDRAHGASAPSCSSSMALILPMIPAVGAPVHSPSTFRSKSSTSPRRRPGARPRRSRWQRQGLCPACPAPEHGAKAGRMPALVPQDGGPIIRRCSGHAASGAGPRTENFDIAVMSASRLPPEGLRQYFASWCRCPLAPNISCRSWNDRGRENAPSLYCPSSDRATARASEDEQNRYLLARAKTARHPVLPLSD